MMILGPLVAPRTSTVTAALSRPVAVTFSPSTTITTGRLRDAPATSSVLSISMTSPTATFCCLLPLRTIAYTSASLSSSLKLGSGGTRHPQASGEVSTQKGVRTHAEDQLYAVAGCAVKTAALALRVHGHRLRDPFFFTGTWTSEGPWWSS